MGRVATPLLTFGAIVLLAFILISTAYSLLLIGLAGRAGLPYPEEGYEGTVYLKEALIMLDVQSTWGMVSQYPPWHSVTLNHYARYVFENTGGSSMLFENTSCPTSLIQVKVPISATLREVTFKLDGRTMDYMSVEYIRESPEPGSGVIMEIYTFTIEFSAQSQRILEVQARELGATSIEAQYTYYMMNASRWLRPIRKFDAIFQLKGGEFISSTIAPKMTEATKVTWSLTELIPSQDLLIKWRITEPQPPVQEFGIMQGDPSWSPYPYLVIGIVITITALFSARILRKLFIL